VWCVFSWPFRLPLVVRIAATLLLSLISAPLGLAATNAPVATVAEIRIDGPITPSSADYFVRSLAQAIKSNAQLVVLSIDTPGGLDQSMRQIIRAILASQVPVATYVAPSGARAASAGTYILYASHITAMAPGTNLGAATPVQVGGRDEGPAQVPPKGKEADKTPPSETSGQAMTRKQVSDAAAFIRGLAQLRGRNAEWAERAVREAVSLSANEALQQKVVEYIASDLTGLLKQLDGKTVNVQGRDRILQTAGAEVLHYTPDWRSRFLGVITDPSVALILMMLGIYGLLFEFSSPGVGLGGVLGAICLLLAAYALQLLPVNYAGLALVILGIGLMVAEAFVGGVGVLGVGGVAAFIFGAIILIDTDVSGYGIPTGLIVGIAIFSAILIVVMIKIALRTRRQRVVSGADMLLGLTAEVVSDVAGGTRPEGWGRIQGENWKIFSKAPLRKGDRARVVARKGLVLEVEPVGRNANNNGELS